MTQLSLTLAAAKRDDGIQRAAEHAGEEWTEHAMRFLRQFVTTRKFDSTPFLAEDVRDYCEQQGVPPPPDKRAWGHVMQLAAKRSYIRQAGYLRAKSSNLSPKVAWVPA